MKEEVGLGLNEQWEQRIRDKGADFVCFVDITMLPAEMTEGYPCAVLFGKALSREYIRMLRAGLEPEHKEMNNTERKMDALAVKVAGWLEAEGHRSVGKLKAHQLPHKTVALRAGLGFIGKNNLLVTPKYGCALLLGKVLTNAPFATTSDSPQAPQCGECSSCVDACPTDTLLGTCWTVTSTREEMMVRKRCVVCLKCMVNCPFTEKYACGQDT